jgi:hypothetical protein
MSRDSEKYLIWSRQESARCQSCGQWIMSDHDTAALQLHRPSCHWQAHDPAGTRIICAASSDPRARADSDSEPESCVFVFKPRPQEARERTRLNIKLNEPALHRASLACTLKLSRPGGRVGEGACGAGRRQWHHPRKFRLRAWIGAVRNVTVGRPDTPQWLTSGPGFRSSDLACTRDYVNRWGIDWATDERMPASQIDEDDTSNDDSDGEEGMDSDGGRGMEDNM